MSGKIIRKKVIGIVLIISMAVSCFVLVNVADLVGKITREYSNTKLYSKMMYATVSYNQFVDNEEFIYKEIVDYLCRCEAGNVYVETLVTVGNERKEYTIAIIMAKNMDIPGAGFHEEMLEATNSALIGESLKGFVKDGAIVLGNSKVDVGIMDNVMSSEIDNRFYIIYDMCDDTLKDYLDDRMNSMLNVVMYGDKRTEQQFKEFIYYAKDNNFSCHEYASDGVGGFENRWYKITNGIVFFISLVFAVINVYIVSELWLKSRSREIAIRKAYGYSEGMLFTLLYKDMLLHGVVAMAVTLIVQLLYKIIFEKVMLDIITAIEIVGVFAGMLIIALINVLRLQKEIRNIEPARFLARREK